MDGQAVDRVAQGLGCDQALERWHEARAGASDVTSNPCNAETPRLALWALPAGKATAANSPSLAGGCCPAVTPRKITACRDARIPSNRNRFSCRPAAPSVLAWSGCLERGLDAAEKNVRYGCQLSGWGRVKHS